MSLHETAIRTIRRQRYKSVQDEGAKNRMEKEFSGKRVFVTGSGRGIGAAIAKRFAEEGAHTLIHYAQNAAAAEKTAQAIRSAGGSVEILQADISEESQLEELVRRLEQIDILILNASMQFRTPWEKIKKEEFRKQTDCNLYASLRLIQHCVPWMRTRHWGRIITIGSVQEKKPHPDMLIYSATKAAQSNMVVSLAGQLAKDGITVNNVAPGVIYTDRNRGALSDEEYARNVRESIPAGFYGTPEDCSGIVVQLAREESRYLTGQTVFVDGGTGIG